jgi:hypothetical protein
MTNSSVILHLAIGMDFSQPRPFSDTFGRGAEDALRIHKIIRVGNKVSTKLIETLSTKWSVGMVLVKCYEQQWWAGAGPLLVGPLQREVHKHAFPSQSDRDD